MVEVWGGWGRESQGVWDGHGHTAGFNMENQQGPAVQHRGLCSMLCNKQNGKRILKRIGPCVCVTESPDHTVNRWYSNIKVII